MMVGEWLSSWLCREEGVELSSASDERLNFKLVLAEPLENSSHVQKFLSEHGGPGLQHIGLVSKGDIGNIVEKMQISGAEFRKPPPTYYKLVSKNHR